MIESGPEPTRTVGRPSPVVRPHPDVVAFAVNPELDAITVGMVGLFGQVVARRRLPLDRVVDAVTAARLAAELIADLRAAEPGRRVVGVGIAVPGLVRAGDGLVRWAPHLGWHDAPLAELMTASTTAPAFAGNDATLGAIAERTFGAARGVDDLVYLNGGASGIGGGIIVAGRPLTGVDGYAGEFGHLLVGVHPPDGRENRELEGIVSRARLLATLGLTSATPDELDDALRSTAAGEVLDELARQRTVLSFALAQAINIFNPGMVVLGGFLASLHAADPTGFRRLVSEGALAGPFDTVRIVEAELGADLLLIGAAELAVRAAARRPRRVLGAGTGLIAPVPGPAATLAAAGCSALPSRGSLCRCRFTQSTFSTTREALGVSAADIVESAPVAAWGTPRWSCPGCCCSVTAHSACCAGTIR